MDLPKYAKLEIERRFLANLALAPDLSGRLHRKIEDLYIDGGRLRLRAMTDSATGQSEFKLCKKYHSGDALAGPITNLYLSQPEHAALADITGARLTKRRYSVDDFSLDVFEGALAGLVMCEAEAETREAAQALHFPTWCVREVTEDPFFTGGNLCRVSATDLAARLYK